MSVVSCREPAGHCRRGDPLVRKPRHLFLELKVQNTRVDAHAAPESAAKCRRSRQWPLFWAPMDLLTISTQMLYEIELDFVLGFLNGKRKYIDFVQCSSVDSLI